MNPPPGYAVLPLANKWESYHAPKGEKAKKVTNSLPAKAVLPL